MSLIRLKEIPEFVVKTTRVSTDAPLAKSVPKKISFYLEGPRSRDIFKFGDFGRSEEAAEEPEEEVLQPGEKILSESELLAQNLGLVGIGWSDDPDVMVENLETKEIYFLKRGQRINGLIKVEAIFQDRVVLTYDSGKEMELR